MFLLQSNDSEVLELADNAYLGFGSLVRCTTGHHADELGVVLNCTNEFGILVGCDKDLLRPRHRIYWLDDETESWAFDNELIKTQKFALHQKPTPVTSRQRTHRASVLATQHEKTLATDKLAHSVSRHAQTKEQLLKNKQLNTVAHTVSRALLHTTVRII